MRKLIVLLGLLGGGFTGFLLVVFNPLVDDSLQREIVGAGVYRYASSDVYGMHSTADGLLNIARLLRGPADFDEAAIRNTVAAVMVLRDSSDAPVAFATRLSASERNSNLLFGEFRTRSYWNVFWPNQGSVYMQSLESRRELLHDGMSSFLVGGEPQAGGERYMLTMAGEGAGNRIVGISGLYSSATGHYSEVLLNPINDPDIQRGELQLSIKR